MLLSVSIPTLSCHQKILAGTIFPAAMVAVKVNGLILKLDSSSGLYSFVLITVGFR